jgi:hypothetical protein
MVWWREFSDNAAQPGDGRMTNGVLYVAVGERWCREASEAATLVKRHMPGLPITLFADRPWAAEAIDDVRVMKADGNPLLTKTLWMADSPYDRTLFLDTDITLCDSIAEIFALCDRFDLAVPHAPYRLAQMGLAAGLPEFLREGVPECFPGMNTGMLVYNRCDRVTAFFTAWCQHHIRHCAITPHAPSQPAFRTAIYQSDLRFAIIPEEYHCRFIYPFKVCGRVKVFHGRHPDMDLVARRINASPLPRVGEGYLVEAARRDRRLSRLQRWRSWAIGTLRRGVFRALRNVLPKAGGAETDAPLPPPDHAAQQEIPNGGIVSLV